MTKKRKGNHSKSNNLQGESANSSENSSPEAYSRPKQSRLGPATIGLTLPPEIVHHAAIMPTNAELVKTIGELSVSVKNLQATIDRQESRIKDLCEENAEIKKELSEMKKQTLFTEHNFKSFFLSAMTDWENEREERSLKKTNFVVYGMPEGKDFDNEDIEDITPEQQKETDRQLAIKIVESAGFDSASITDVSRMGSGKKRDGSKSKYPKLVKVKTDSEELKKAVLKQQKEIFAEIPVMSAHKDTFSQYIRPDMTFAERARHFDLVGERNRLNATIAEGQPKYKVYNLSLVKSQGNLARA